MKAVLAKLLVGCLSIAAVAGVGGATGNATGTPSSSSRSSALDPVYYVKDLFIDQIYRYIDLGCVVAVTQEPPAILGTWPTIQAILAAVAPIAACIIIGILFCVIMPIMGLCCCCCRLCNRCGGKAPYMDPPRATCKRVTCSFLLLVLTTLVLFGAVETFLSINELNKQLQNDNAGSALSQFNQRVADMFDEVSSTVNLPLQSLSELSTKVNSILDASGADMFQNLSNVSPDFMTMMETKLNNSVSGIANLSSLLTIIKTAQVSINQSQLTQCCSSSMSCNVVINANYSQFNLSLLQDGTISNARSVLRGVQDIYEVLNSSISTSTNSVKASSAAIILGQQNLLQNFSKSLAIWSLKSKVQLDNLTSDAISNFSNYVLYAGFGLGGVVAFIVLLLYLALCCGMCGRRVGEGSSSCNKGCGASLLVAATTFMFIFSWIIMLVTLSLFPSSAFHLPCWLVDGNISKMVNSDNLDTANVSFITDGKSTFTITRLETAFSDCQSKSAYSVLASLFPELGDVLASITKRDSWADSSDLVNRIRNESITLPSNASETANSLVAIIGSLQSLAKVAMELQTLGKPFTPDLDSVAANLKTTEQLCNDTRTNLTLLANDTSAILTELAGLTPVVSNWLLNASQSAQLALVGLQALLQKSASAGSVSMPPQVVNITIDGLMTAANKTVDELKTYPCKDLIYTPVTKVTDLLCSNLLDPLDAFWFSLGLSVTLFVPVIIVSLYLVSLYRRQEPFKSQKDRWEDPGYHEDDGVTIRDSVPLDNMPSSRKSMQYHQDADYSNNGYLGPHDDLSGSVPPPYYGHYNGGNGGGGAHRGGNFPRVVPNPTNSDVTYGGPPAAMAISQKRY